jgi:hypothetical protein
MERYKNIEDVIYCMGSGKDFWTILCVLLTLIGSTCIALKNFSTAEFFVLLILLFLGFIAIISSSQNTKRLFFLLVLVNVLYFLGLGLIEGWKVWLLLFFAILGLLLSICSCKRCKSRCCCETVDVKPVKETKKDVVKKTGEKTAKAKKTTKKATKRKTKAHKAKK